MTNAPIRLALVAAVALGAATLAPGAAAQDCGVERQVKTAALDEATWKRLNSIYEDVGEEKYAEAYEGLKELEKRAGKDKYLAAVVAQGLAQVEWARENYDAALREFERAVELDALPDNIHFALMYQISQLYYMQERYDEALDRLQLWFCKSPQEKITSAAYVLEASIHQANQDYAKALTSIEKAISMDDNPKEAWYQLKLASHYELEQFPQAAETLETMITRWPDKRDYWVQLSQIYYRLKQEQKALSTVALAYRNNMLDRQSDILYLSSLYSNSGVPYKAAKILQKGIEDGVVEPTQRNWTMVGDNWYAAEEMDEALAAFEKAGEAALDGDIDLRRGYILIDLEKWDQAKEALSAALEKGGIDDRKTGEAHLLLGMAEFNLGNWDRASTEWGRASRYPKSRQAAQQWMNHLREERAKRA